MADRAKLTLTEKGCPYCQTGPTRNAVHRIVYSETHLAAPNVEDFEGWVEECERCGVYLVNPRYDEQEFAVIYRHLSRKGSGASLVKRLASVPLRVAIAKWHQPNLAIRWPVRALGRALDPLLHITIPPRGLTGGRVLDIGCGDGFHLRCFGQLGCELYGTEIHSGYAPLLERGPEKIRFWIKEFSQVDWENEVGWEAFDLILLQSVFYRLNNPLEVLQMIWKLLAPGGEILRLEPYCPDLDSIRFMTRFNFPQGFTFIRDLPAHVGLLEGLLPGAEISYDILYGRSRKLVTGKELTLFTAVDEVFSTLAKSLLHRQPWFVRLRVRKPEAP